MSTAEFLASFVPDWILRRLAVDPSPPGGPWSEACDAAVLFADLSGFTPLAEQLAQQGSAGAERLGDLLDQLTSRQVAIVAAHGGDVFGFAGDAAIGVWPADPAEGEAGLSRAVVRAAGCGRELQAALAEQGLQAIAGAPLRLRVGIGAGRVLLATTGSAGGHCEAYAAGTPLAQMAIAQRQANPGEVLLSPAAAALAADRLDTVPAGEGCARVIGVRQPETSAATLRTLPGPAAEAALRGFVPAAVLARLDAGQDSWLAEFRRVVTLFVNLGGIDYEAPDAPRRVATAVACMRAAIAKYDGTLHQFIVDDKGTTIVAAWGLPGQSHEDNAVRALQATRELLDALAAQGLTGSAGITTGRVFTGTKGSDARRVFTVVGDAVNLSARLVDKAAGGVLVDSATREAASRAVAFEEQAPLILKGKEKPVPVSRPIYAVAAGEAVGPDRAGAGSESVGSRMDGAAGVALVGRHVERATIDSELAALVVDGRSGMLVLEGEPGIGKSRLVQELIRRAGAHGASVLLGAGDAIEQNTAYHPWRSVLAQVLGLGGLSAAERGAAVRERVRGEAQWLAWAPLLSMVMAIDLEESEAVRQMTEQARADALRELIVGLLRQRALAGPTVLILEDAHWLDSSSWTLVLAMRRRVQPLLLVLATRPIQVAPTTEAKALLEDTGARRLRLESLAPEEAVTLVCQRLGVPALPVSVAELIKRKAEGHPFFSEELIYALRDTGVIRIEAGRCLLSAEAGDLATMVFPDTVEGVITTRIDRLGPKEQLTLKVASVVGRTFASRVLGAVHPVESDRPELPEQLGHLEDHGLVLAEAPMPEASHVFKHIITQEVSYELLLHSQRRTLHREVARFYEAAASRGSATPFPVLAHHWERAEDSAKAMEYLERAGEQALAASANREAGGFFERAIALAEQVELVLPEGPERAALTRRRARWERLYGDACLKLAEYGRTREHFANSMALWQHPYPGGAVSLTLTLLSQVARQGLHLLLPGRWVRTRDEREREAAREVSLMHQRQAEIFYFEQKMPALLHATFANLNFAERAGTAAELTLAYATVAIVSGLFGLHPLARMYSARAVKYADRVTDERDLPVVAYSWLLRGVYIYSTGAWDEAEKYYRKSLELFDRLGDRFRWENANTSIGWQNLFRGRFAAARERFHESLESARRDGTAKMRMWALASDLAARIPEQVPDGETVAALEAELAHPLDHGDRVFGQGMRLQARFVRGEIDAAIDAAGTMVKLLEGLPPSTAYCAHGVYGAFQTFRALAARARLARSDAEALRWGRGARQASLVLRVLAFQNPIVAPRSLLARADLAEDAGKAGRARRLRQRAEGIAERLGLEYDRQLARTGAGPGDGR